MGGFVKSCAEWLLDAFKMAIAFACNLSTINSNNNLKYLWLENNFCASDKIGQYQTYF